MQMLRRKSPAKQGKNTRNTIILTVKRFVKLLLITAQGYITPNTYKIYNKLFHLFDLKEV